MTIRSEKDLLEMLHAKGAARRFRPYQEPETGTILIRTRRPPQIIDGWLRGCEIELCDPATFRVWTSQKRKAAYYARTLGLKFTDLDGECELFVPVGLADDVLPKLGAKVRRTMSQEQIEALKQAMAKIRSTPT